MVTPTASFETSRYESVCITFQFRASSFQVNQLAASASHMKEVCLLECCAEQAVKHRRQQTRLVAE